MNGYKLTFLLKKTRDDTYLSATDQALFHELVSVCNEKKWVRIFAIKNEVLCSNLNITEKTLIKSRKTLAQNGLVYFRSSTDKRHGCHYSFTDAFSTGTATGETPETPVLSTGNDTAETLFTPINSIKTINKESNALPAPEAAPRKKAPATRQSKDHQALVYPFTSERFMHLWTTLRNSPKWKKKLNNALQISLNKLGAYPEEFALYQMMRAIECNWTGVVFHDTDKDYEHWRKSTENNRNPDRGTAQPAGIKSISF